MKQIFLTGSLLSMLLAAAWSVPIYAQQLQAQREDPIAMYREAGIDAGQEKKIMGMVNSYEKNEDERAHQLIGNLNKLRALSVVPDLDEKQILQTQEIINKLQNEMAMDKMHLLINIRRVLNSDQRVRLVALLQKRNSSNGAASQ